MSQTTANIAAKTDKAGRKANQDNFLLIPDVGNIGGHSPEDVNRDKPLTLNEMGTLLAVADGMGGMSSGEVASETIVNSLRQSFGAITPADMADDNSIVEFIRKAISKADKQVKAYAKANPRARGLGSTLVLAWMLRDKAYCAWVGDSRIYCYNPATGLERISHDHSYVQALVDSGNITDDEAFTHPDGNIITRSIGDNGEPVEPDTRIVPLREGDVWLLCSDGLCGLLRDNELRAVIEADPKSSLTTLRSLWAQGDQRGWSDNATILLYSVLGLGTQSYAPAATTSPVTNAPNQLAQPHGVMTVGNVAIKWSTAIIALAAILMVILGIIWYQSRQPKADKRDADPLKEKIEQQQQHVKALDTPQAQAPQPANGGKTGKTGSMAKKEKKDVDKDEAKETTIDPNTINEAINQTNTEEQPKAGGNVNQGIQSLFNQGNTTTDNPDKTTQPDGE